MKRRGRPGFETVWWTGLIGALAATLVILNEVFLVLRALQGIDRLAQRTRAAARGIAANTSATSSLPALGPPVEAVNSALDGIERNSAALAGSLGAVAGELGLQGGRL